MNETDFLSTQKMLHKNIYKNETLLLKVDRGRYFSSNSKHTSSHRTDTRPTSRKYVRVLSAKDTLRSFKQVGHMW